MDASTLQKAGLDEQFHSEYADVNGMRLHYVRGGTGQPVILLHGWPLTWYSWRKIMPDLAKHYDVIAVDLPGLGDSGPPSVGYEKQNVAADVHALSTTLNLDPTIIIGHDMGAPVAYAMARLYPNTVERLVILDVPMAGFGLDEFQHRAHIWHFDFFQKQELAEQLIAGHERALIESFYPENPPDAITANDRDEYARTYTRPGALIQSLAFYRAFPKDEDWTKETAKPKLEVPTLTIGGERAGAYAPFESLSQLAHNVTGRILRDCGHYLAEEKPQELLAELFRFLSEPPIGD